MEFLRSRSTEKPRSSWDSIPRQTPLSRRGYMKSMRMEQNRMKMEQNRRRCVHYNLSREYLCCQSATCISRSKSGM